MNKEEVKNILNKLGIDYEEYEYHLGMSGLQLEKATSYIKLNEGGMVTLFYAVIYLYFDKDDNLITIEASE